MTDARLSPSRVRRIVRAAEVREDRDADILHLTAAGLTNDEIADEVGVSVRTVQRVRARLAA
jgi:DNA-binding NarL/FixJ family response regulator